MIEISIYDVAGRVLRTLASGMKSPGCFETQWSGDDDLGRKVPAGIYFVRFESEDHKEYSKVILLK
jgi:flagellar hook assembly protein FlgD